MWNEYLCQGALAVLGPVGVRMVFTGVWVECTCYGWVEVLEIHLLVGPRSQPDTGQRQPGTQPGPASMSLVLLRKSPLL